MSHIRIALTYILYYTGILSILKRFLLRKKAVVLTYHRVLSESERIQSFSHEAIVVSSRSFAEQMQYVKEWFHVISEEDFLERLQTKKPFEKYSCLITFDDGWRDNYTNAYPLLKENGLPAVIFLPVDFVGTGKQFWQERMSAALFALCQDTSREGRQLLDVMGLKHMHSLSCDQLKEPIQGYIARVKGYSPDERAVVLSHLFEYTETTPFLKKSVDLFVDWEQVVEMNRGGIAFGSHGYHHNILTQLTEDDAAVEVHASRREIGERLGVLPRTFCYPNGDFSERIAGLVSSGGYEAAFSTKAGFVDCNDNPFAVKRVNIHEHISKTKPLFLARILNIF